MCCKLPLTLIRFFKSRWQPKPQKQHEPPHTQADMAIQNGTDLLSPGATVRGTSKVDTDMWEFYVNMVQRNIEEETNPVRRQNAQVCLEFLRQHGYPAHGYHFSVHQEIMLVLTTEQDRDRDGQIFRRVGGSLKDSYGLVSYWHFHSCSIFSLYSKENKNEERKTQQKKEGGQEEFDGPRHYLFSDLIQHYPVEMVNVEHLPR